MRRIITHITNSDFGINSDLMIMDRKMPMSGQPLPLQLDIWTHILRYVISIPCETQLI